MFLRTFLTLGPTIPPSHWMNARIVNCIVTILYVFDILVSYIFITVFFVPYKWQETTSEYKKYKSEECSTNIIVLV